jgi:hypothetical protein
MKNSFGLAIALAFLVSAAHASEICPDLQGSYEPVCSPYDVIHQTTVDGITTYTYGDGSLSTIADGQFHDDLLIDVFAKGTYTSHCAQGNDGSAQLVITEVVTSQPNGASSSGMFTQIFSLDQNQNLVIRQFISGQATPRVVSCAKLVKI